jgi:hypothetical protein
VIVYPGPGLFPFRIPDPGSKRAQIQIRNKEFTQKIVTKFSDPGPGGAKKALDPGSRSATPLTARHLGVKTHDFVVTYRTKRSRNLKFEGNIVRVSYRTIRTQLLTPLSVDLFRDIQCCGSGSAWIPIVLGSEIQIRICNRVISRILGMKLL